MHRKVRLTTSIGGAVTVALASLGFALSAGASQQLASVVSQTPESWTPEVSGGPEVGERYCNTTFFGTGVIGCQSEVYDTAYVNGDIVAVGAFTEVCRPPVVSGELCAPGTQVKRDDIFAYSAGSGQIDPHFVPVLNAGPAWSVVAGPDDTIYVGGQFSTVNGVTHGGLVELNVRPGVTSGTTADGSVVSGFDGNVDNQVQALALSPDHKALYVGGQFTGVDGVSAFANHTKVDDVARLNASTGALDNSFAFTVGDPIAGLADRIGAMALSPDGGHLAFAGSFLQVDGQYRPRLAIVDTGTTIGGSAHLTVFKAPILANGCQYEHDYIRGIASSPEGSFIVTAATGLSGDGSTPFGVCDAVARFNTGAASLAWSSGEVRNVPPSWVDWAGDDSFYAVAVAGGVVYAGGHNRWVNNYCGKNYVCEPNASLVDGLSALDANTGIGLPWWHPQTLRGDGTMYLNTFPANTYDDAKAGLIQGTDVDNIAGAYHSEEAIFPIAPTTSATPRGPVPSGLFTDEDGANTGNPMCMDDPGNSSTSGTPVELRICVNDAEQNWTVEGDGTVEINGLCLDTSAGATPSGTPVELRTCAGTRTQRWIQEAGNTLVNVGATAAAGRSQVCLADTGRSTVNGNPLQIWTCDGATSQVWPLPAAQGPPSPPANGEIWPEQIQVDEQIPCLDDAGDSVTAGTPVELMTCSGDPEQRWTIESNGTIQINGHCLDSASASQTGTVNVVLNPCDGGTTQLWRVGSRFGLVSQGASTLNRTPYCLLDPTSNGTNGTQMQLTVCRGGFDEAWRLPAL